MDFKWLNLTFEWNNHIANKPKQQLCGERAISEHCHCAPYVLDAHATCIVVLKKLMVKEMCQNHDLIWNSSWNSINVQMYRQRKWVSWRAGVHTPHAHTLHSRRATSQPRSGLQRENNKNVFYTRDLECKTLPPLPQHSLVIRTELYRDEISMATDEKKTTHQNTAIRSNSVRYSSRAWIFPLFILHFILCLIFFFRWLLLSPFPLQFVMTCCCFFYFIIYMLKMMSCNAENSNYVHPNNNCWLMRWLNIEEIV